MRKIPLVVPQGRAAQARPGAAVSRILRLWTFARRCATPQRRAAGSEVGHVDALGFGGGVADQLDDVHLRVAGIGDALYCVEVDVEAPVAVLAERQRERLQRTERAPYRLSGAPALVEVAQRAVAELGDDTWQLLARVALDALPPRFSLR